MTLASSNTTTLGRRRHSGVLLTIGIVSGLLVVTSSLMAYGNGISGWREATHLTARFSLFVFLTAFLIGPLARVLPSAFTRMLLHDRRGVGLAFAGAHAVHLVAFLTYFKTGGTVPSQFVIVFGGLGYVLIAIMTGTSNSRSVARLGARNWRRLHTFGMYYIWMTFVFTYLARIAMEPRVAIYRVLLPVLVGAFLFRIAVARFSRFGRQPERL